MKIFIIKYLKNTVKGIIICVPGILIFPVVYYFSKESVEYWFEVLKLTKLFIPSIFLISFPITFAQIKNEGK